MTTNTACSNTKLSILNILDDDEVGEIIRELVTRDQSPIEMALVIAQDALTAAIEAETPADLGDLKDQIDEAMGEVLAKVPELAAA